MKKFKSTLALGLLLATNTLLAMDINIAGSVMSDNQKMITSRYMGIVKKCW
jgi:hypothetical protein